MGLQNFYAGETHLDMPRLWRWALSISVILLVASVASLAIRGLNLGIDFEGGTAWEYRSNGVSVDEVRTTLEPFGADNAKIQTVGTGDEEVLRISTSVEADTLSDDDVDAVRGALADLAGVEPGAVTVTRVTGVWDVPAQDISEGEVRAALEPVGYGDALVTIDENSVTVQAETVVLDMTAALDELFGEEALTATSVGPSWGEEITRQAVRALIFFFVAMAIYISVRLEWRMAIGALVAVVHDIVISVGIYSILGLEVTPSTVIAFLTILGFSLYDTIVVYDKVRDNASRPAVASKLTYTELMSLSLNQTVTRSVNTSVTAILPVLSILVIGSVLFGAVTLQEFGLALLIGLVVGTYSSLFVAAPVVTWLKEREPANRDLRRRLEASRDAAGRVATRPKSTGPGEQGDVAAAEGTDAGGTDAEGTDASSRGSSSVATATRPAGGTWPGHAPRGRKKSKRKR